MHDRFRRAAAEGAEIRRKRDEEAMRNTLDAFWRAVAEAESWVQNEEHGLPSLIRDQAVRGQERITLNTNEEMAKQKWPAGHAMWEYYLQQVITAGIRVEPQHMNPNILYYTIPIAQFLGDAP